MEKPGPQLVEPGKAIDLSRFAQHVAPQVILGEDPDDPDIIIFRLSDRSVYVVANFSSERPVLSWNEQNEAISGRLTKAFPKSTA